ncbi:MAG: DASS family sodium-coupled anion symporter [Chitinophagales bacterium]
MKKWLSIAAGPVLAFGAYLWLSHSGVPQEARLMGLVVVWVAVWWLTEALHLGVTSLLPFLLMPALGIMKTEEAAMQYMDQIIFLFMGGFFLAYAMEKWGLHKRLAYRIIILMGNKPSKVLMGVMLTAYIISMWVSNTATVMMLIAAVMAIINQKDIYHEDVRKGASSAILLGLSFAATIGGMGTLVGTPPNMIFFGMYNREFPAGQKIDFLHWMLFGVPFSFTFLICAYFILKRMFIPERINHPFNMQSIHEQRKSLGQMGMEEIIVLALFAVTVLLWFFRENLDLGFVTIPGWAPLLFGKYAAYIKDSSVVIFTALFLFILPSAKNKDENILEWKDVSKLPLNIILLFGAGFAMAKGFETSGLSAWMANQLQVLNGAPTVFILLGIILLVTVLSEFASNTASIQLVLPVLIPLAATLNINPLLLMLTATFAASMGYMLPVATAANTIVYGTGEIDTKEMMKAGIVLDFVGVILLTLFMCTLGNWLFDFLIFG